MIRAKNYETMSKFVKVMTKILWPLFFPDTVYMLQWCFVRRRWHGELRFPQLAEFDECSYWRYKAQWL